ncbi:hypothetical protein ACWGLF_46255, partial [Streptomyces puniciscabiei]
MTENRGHLRLHQLPQLALLLGRLEFSQLARQAGGSHCARLADGAASAFGGGNEALHNAGQGIPYGSQGGGAQGDGHGDRLVHQQGRVEQGQSLTSLK